MLQAGLQEAPTSEFSVLDWPREEHQTENKYSASIAFHSSSLKNKSCREQL